MALDDAHLLDRIAVDLAEEYRASGVTQVFFVGSMALAGAGAWFCTETDAQRDALIARLLELRVRVQERLAEAGFGGPNLGRSGATVESQETVDRDYDSNWWFAVK